MIYGGESGVTGLFGALEYCLKGDHGYGALCALGLTL